jgi:hypothetical protein
MSDWDWNGKDEQAVVVVPPVQALAVYTNEAGNVVIRQQDMYQDEDDVVVVPKSHLPALIKALQEHLEE